MIDLFEAARQLQVFCDGQGWRSCFIGGLAVQRWGEPRVTLDVDLTVLTGFGEEGRFIDALLAAYPGRIQDAREFACRHRVVLLRTPDGVGIDVSLGALPFEERVISEDMIVLKLFASRPLDIRDAEGVAVRQHDQLDWLYIEEQLRPLAEIKDEPAILSTMARLRGLSDRPGGLSYVPSDQLDR